MLDTTCEVDGLEVKVCQCEVQVCVFDLYIFENILAFELLMLDHLPVFGPRD